MQASRTKKDSKKGKPSEKRPKLGKSKSAKYQEGMIRNMVEDSTLHIGKFLLVLVTPPFPPPKVPLGTKS